MRASRIACEASQRREAVGVGGYYTTGSLKHRLNAGSNGRRERRWPEPKMRTGDGNFQCIERNIFARAPFKTKAKGARRSAFIIGAFAARDGARRNEFEDFLQKILKGARRFH
ncbi:MULTISPECIES: hypothetical protein [Burkholderia]|uniref:Uncharacterized protein n=1 Tax=Burkholderia mayonis TaxID=1385591 RepID=A0A1B4FDB9_9BURK|nr:MULTISPECIES: hypothetical protein [Burkholderia]AOJ01639.1 hypothetical protein WS70_07185 [Burkholderia mayonis]KVE47503.1 hypothetical protein WS70_27230 [Burkholderia mayonis]